MLFAAVESIIALVAAIALTALNHIFFAQRREEFGILHAVGRSRPWLVLRTTKETASTVSVAWLLGALVCVIGLVSFRALVYVPRGLSLNFFNPTPWLFTLPIPLAVIAVGAGTIARTLSRLDPLAVIEGRQA
jgi:ABC-type antimicrobial peptide transport system permease subunit